jgi:hypothetical protein
MNVDGLTNDEVKSHLQVRNCFFFLFCRSSLISSICSHFALHFEHLGRASEVSSPHSAPELGGGGGPERRHQRRCSAGRAAVRRGGWHLGATAGVRCRCRCGSRSAAAAADNNRRQGVRAGGDDVDARTATASGEAVEQLLRRAAQRGRLLWLAGRVVVVVADRLCLMNAVGQSVADQLGFYVLRYSQTYTRESGILLSVFVIKDEKKKSGTRPADHDCFVLVKKQNLF